MKEIRSNERMIGAPIDDDRGSVPGVPGNLEALNPAAKDRLIGFQIERALGTSGIRDAAKKAATVAE